MKGGTANVLTVQAFDSIDTWLDHPKDIYPAPHVFLLSSWLKAWWQTFQPNAEPHVCSVKMNGELIGAAWLAVSGATASFMGDPEICDYLDFAVAPGYESTFYHALLDHLTKSGVTKLDLRCLRPESTVSSHLVEEIRKRGGTSHLEPDGVTMEMNLPGDWNEYMEGLKGTQRHELKRKLRRLHEAADVRFHVMEHASEVAEQFDAFLRMFRESRPDKARFMNRQMESFFRSMISALSKEGIVRLFVLDLNDAPAASSLCFDYNDTVYLYNSGYDPRYSSLSAGLLCKVLSIRHSIENGRKRYDFLKGAEPYKYQLGGKEVRLSRCRCVFR